MTVVTAPPSRGYVLLANARPEKGFDLILEVAARRPEIRFLVVASQSPRAPAEAAVAARGLLNVEIRDKVDDMGPLYAGARVVAAPSYRFKETFSRVCIEAHRRGLPVLGATSGNIPYLLERSGIVLPEDPDAWAEELGRLYDDADHYACARARARANSARYGQEVQRRAFRDILATFDRSILVGVGSGIGNILHCGPMVRNLARRLGRRVDLVVAADYPGNLFLLHHPDYVGTVWRLSDTVLRRRYDTVFLTHSFGMVRAAFDAGETLRSRDWANFKPGESSHETVFNLEAAEALMGVPFDEDDAHHPFVADIDYHWPAGHVVGVHGGSKEGYWASKRWGGFPELAARLTARGYEVRSFGTPEEHVPGTRDMTGGSIEEMTLALRDCAYFVSNDSGVMNLANALGVPVTAVFGPTDIATRRPLRPWNVVVGPEGGGPATEVADPKLFKSGGCTSIDTVTVDRVMAGFDRMVDRVRAAREALAS